MFVRISDVSRLTCSSAEFGSGTQAAVAFTALIQASRLFFFFFFHHEANPLIYCSCLSRCMPTLAPLS